MKKYLSAFKITIARVSVHRLDFLLKRVHNIVIVLLLYFVWLSLSQSRGTFAGFTTEELTTYVFVASIIRIFFFGADTRHVSFDINEGRFSMYLTRPINHFVFNYFEELAEKAMHLFFGFIELLAVGFLLNVDFFAQTDPVLIGLFLLSVFLAHILFYIMTYAMALISFWSREAMGPRFLFDWIMDFAAGTIFPLSILSSGLFYFFSLLPFMYVMYAPIMLYLGKYSGSEIVHVFVAQIISILVCGTIARIMWIRGLRHYSGEGI